MFLRFTAACSLVISSSPAASQYRELQPLSAPDSPPEVTYSVSFSSAHEYQLRHEARSCQRAAR